MDKTMEISGCEVCGNTRLETVLNLGRHPLCDDLISIGDPRHCEEYPIEVLYCSTCRTAHQRVQVSKQVLFPDSYHYRARFTKDVLDGMASLVDSCEEKLGSLAGKTVLDVGCNDGSLLGFFREKGAKTIGIEPTGAYADAQQSGHTVFHDFLSDDVARQIVGKFGQPDIVTFTNVFAHISDLKAVLKTLKILLGPKTTLVIENHYLGSVLQGKQFDTFYHEHPRTYSLSSFQWIAKSLGLKVMAAEFPSRYGGNIRVFIGDPKSVEARGALTVPDVDEDRFAEDLRKLGESINRWRDSKRKKFAGLTAQYGALPAKAFPGRAAILFKLLAVDGGVISAVYEKPGSKKIGHYVPGTRIPIVSEEELFAGDMSKPIVNLAWHIPKEIHGYLTEHGYKGPVIEILDKDDLA